jgi:G3E family GTPase
MLIENLKATHTSHHAHHHHEHDHEHEHHEHGGHVCNDPNCACHSHHANEVFESFSSLTPKNFSKEGIEDILSWFEEGVFGEIIRAKGVLNGSDGWLFFDYVPGSIDVRLGSADVSGKVCVIGKNLQKEKLKDIF